MELLLSELQPGQCPVTWVSRKGLDRWANLDSSVLVYDGQKAKYVPAENVHGFLMQVLASVSAPQDLYGTTALMWRYRESQKRDSVWMYVSALRRVREMSPSNRSDGFLGSEMTQDDGRFFERVADGSSERGAGKRPAGEQPLTDAVDDRCRLGASELCEVSRAVEDLCPPSSGLESRRAIGKKA